MAILYESYGSFSTGIPSFRQMVSKKSKGTIILTETFLSFESLVDKILFQVKLSEIQDICRKIRFKITLIELQTPHHTFYTLYPMKKKNNSYSPSKEMTMELFRQLTRLIYNRNQTILFDAIASFHLNSLLSYDLKENTIHGQLFLTENYILFKSFHSKGIYKIDVLDIKDVTMEIEDSTIYVKIEANYKRIYYVFPLKRQRRKLIKDNLKAEKFYDVLNQATMYKQTEQVRLKKVEKENIKKIKNMLEVSNRLKLKMMRTTLGLEKESFNDRIFEWAKKFHFKIDGDNIIINKETIPAFLHQIISIDKEDNTITETTECLFCGNTVNNKLEVCPYCENNIKLD